MGHFSLNYNFPDTNDGLRRAIKQAEKICRKSVPSTFSLTDFCFTGLLHAIAEIGKSILILCKNGRHHDAGILLRSQMEHLIALMVLEKDSRYTNTLLLENAKSIKAALKQAESGNPFAEGISDLPNFEQNLLNWQHTYEDLSRNGAKSRSFQDLFNKAGLADLYETGYRSLSSLVHPSISGMQKRSLKIDLIKDSVEFDLGLTAPEETVYLVLNSSISAICQATQIIASRMNGSANA
ncbi:MAG: hypothetical protein KKB02_05255 [Alphaproteobacteria bacterium]|nr:hypothetical protein [Alphaproteobacteria bacterium]